MKTKIFESENGCDNEFFQTVIDGVYEALSLISSATHHLKSPAVLDALTPYLQKRGIRMETGKCDCEKILLPGDFEADGQHKNGGIIEIEADKGLRTYSAHKALLEYTLDGVTSLVYITRIKAFNNGNEFDNTVKKFTAAWAGLHKIPNKRGVLVIGY
jgi:hypothetical protein